MARRLDTWEKFEPRARLFLESFALQNGRPPHTREMLAADGFWLLHAAAKYHGGYTNVLKRLGYTPPRREYNSDDRRRNWDRFATDAGPIIAEYVTRLQRLPTQLELQAGGHSWISSAAATHHGGLIATFEALGHQVQLPRLLTDWNMFVARVKPQLERAAQHLGGTPSVSDLKELRLAWIATAAYKYHGGYDRVRQALGFPPPPHKLRGRGLANWSHFESECRPVLEALWIKLGRLPTTGELIQLGHQRYVFAARNFHGGYIAVAQRWGLPASPNQTMQQRPRWSSRIRQWETLLHHFRTYLDVGIMPPSTLIHGRCAGLYAYWNRSGKTWSQVATSFGLQDAKAGHTMLTYKRVVDEALEHYETNRRWPRVLDMSPSLKLLWARYKSWDKLFCTFNLTSQLLELVITRHRQHYRWLQSNYPEQALSYIRMVNRIVMIRNGYSSPTPPSS